MKQIIIVLIIIAVMAVGIIGFFIWPWVLIFIGISMQPNPPAPDITYGEFPFRLEYEINGELKVIEDVLICEYAGIGMDEGRGKFRKWTKRLASGNERVVLLKISDTKIIDYEPGPAECFMGDWVGEVYELFPNAGCFEEEMTEYGKMTSDSTLEADELLKEYGIKLISWDYTPPIHNTFDGKEREK